MLEALAAIVAAIVAALAGALGWERRKRRKLEDETNRALNAMRDANLARIEAPGRSRSRPAADARRTAQPVRRFREAAMNPTRQTILLIKKPAFSAIACKPLWRLCCTCLSMKSPFRKIYPARWQKSSTSGSSLTDWLFWMSRG
ncbi:MAG: hypothetical protein IPN66_09305 [Candidatus Competibacteraceae bacterium]|nr:hypothetical protein [Candidatus Competibacteraceae bacterium]